MGTFYPQMQLYATGIFFCSLYAHKLIGTLFCSLSTNFYPTTHHTYTCQLCPVLGSIVSITRPIVYQMEIPFGSSRYCLSHSSLAIAHSPISSHSSHLHTVTTTVMNNISINLCRTFLTVIKDLYSLEK